MLYAIKSNKRVEKELSALPTAVYGRVKRAIADLRNVPRPIGAQKLKGSVSTYRVRVGDYRVIYDVEDAVHEVRLLQVGHRKDVYR